MAKLRVELARWSAELAEADRRLDVARQVGYSSSMGQIKGAIIEAAGKVAKYEELGSWEKENNPDRLEPTRLRLVKRSDSEDLGQK